MSIKNAKYPITEISDYKTANDSSVIRDAMYDALNEYKAHNPNSYINSRDNGYPAYDALTMDYETAVTESNWNRIQSKFGDKINERLDKLNMSNEFNMSDIIELKLGKECLLASRDGLNDKQIDYMLDSCIEPGANNRAIFNPEMLSLIREALTNNISMSDIDMARGLNNSDVLLNHMAQSGKVNVDELDVLSSCKNKEAAIAISSCIIDDGLDIDKARDIRDAMNLESDYISKHITDKTLRFTNKTSDSVYDLTSLDSYFDLNIGKSGSAKAIMQDYLNNSDSKSLYEFGRDMTIQNIDLGKHYNQTGYESENIVDKIKQANVPIKEYNGIDNASNHILYANQIPVMLNIQKDKLDNVPISYNSSGYGFNELKKNLIDFTEQNKGNACVDVLDNNKIYTKSEIYDRYNKAVALSHWDEIKSDFGYKITNIINIAHEKEPVLNNKVLTNVALEIGSIAYIEKHNGHSENQINFMLNNALTNHRLDLERLNAAKDLLHEGVSMKDADDILEATSKNFDMFLPIESYILNNGYKTDYDKKAIGVLASSEDVKTGDYMGSLLEAKRITPEIAEGVLSEVNSVKLHMNFNPSDKRFDSMTCVDMAHVLYDMSSKTNNFLDKISGIGARYADDKSGKDFKDFARDDLNLNNKTTNIVIPKGLVSDAKHSEHGDYRIIGVPLDNKMWRMTVAESQVNLNNKTAELNLPLNRDRQLKLYDNHKVCDTKTVSVNHLADIYNKNWEKLNARDKKLDAKFDTQSMLAHKYDAPNLD